VTTMRGRSCFWRRFGVGESFAFSDEFRFSFVLESFVDLERYRNDDSSELECETKTTS